MRLWICLGQKSGARKVPCSLQVTFAWVTGGNAEKPEQLKLKEPFILERKCGYKHCKKANIYYFSDM